MVILVFAETLAGGKQLTRAELATGAWGAGFASRASEVEVYISRLRKKLEWDGGRLIETVLSMLSRVCGLKRVTERCWANLMAHMAATVAAFNVLVGWDPQEPRLAIARFSL